MWKELWYLISLLFTNLSEYLLEIVKMNHFPFKGYLAMSWCGKIITQKPERITNVILNHERIHLELAILLGKTWFNYYWQYFKYWIKGCPIVPPIDSAYYTIPFEMEAYSKEHDFNYKVDKNSWKKYEIKDRKETYKKYRLNWKNYCKNLTL